MGEIVKPDRALSIGILLEILSIWNLNGMNTLIEDWKSQLKEPFTLSLSVVHFAVKNFL
jgi:hypothetical protein